jgi:uncharacterized DUF497 family protein
MDELAITGFEWDAANLAKCQKHGISIVEIEALVMGQPRVAPSPKRGTDEARMIAAGRTDQGRPY